MTEARNVSMFPLLGLIFVLAIVGSWKMNIFQLSFTKHAKTSHAAHVTKIENCFDAGNGSLSPIFRTSQGRWSQYCFDGSVNQWRIYECTEEGERLVITQFRQGVKRLKNYIRNHGMVEASIPC